MKRLRSRLLLSALTMCAMSSYSDALANYGIPIRDPFSPSPKLNANRTLAGATSALDLAADGKAKKLMTDAAQKCGEVVP